MGLLSKIKNALFDEEEVEVKETTVAKKIETSKVEQPVINHYEEEKKEENIPSLEYKKEDASIIFDVEDFIEEKEEVYEEPKKEVSEKILYGGYEVKEYEKIEEKDKFKPSPVISPVYGIVDKNYKKEESKKTESERKPLDRLFVEEKKKVVDFDTIRQKAYGYEPIKHEEESPEEQNLLYEMQELEEKPGIEKISIGDAEEYFEDLGLEYDVDYTDLAKQKMTRAKKNKELTEVVEEEIKEEIKIEQEIMEQHEVVAEKEDTAEEKNLYDLIDMMYEEK